LHAIIAYIRIVGNEADINERASQMSNDTMTSADALNVNVQAEPAQAEPSKPIEAKLPARKPRVLTAKLTSAQLQAQIKQLQAAKRVTLEAERKAKPAMRRSKNGGNTWQIKLVAATQPAAKLDAICKLAKPKLNKNEAGMLPSDATIGTIRTDFYHSMRVFKSLTAKQQAELLKAI
jgi:hypothetical protein